MKASDRIKTLLKEQITDFQKTIVTNQIVFMEGNSQNDQWYRNDLSNFLDITDETDGLTDQQKKESLDITEKMITLI